MTDADLIAALGWEPCRFGPVEGTVASSMWCSAHLSASTANATQPCNTMFHRLIGVRAGIDLAKHIADASTQSLIADLDEVMEEYGEIIPQHYDRVTARYKP